MNLLEYLPVSLVIDVAASAVLILSISKEAPVPI